MARWMFIYKMLSCLRKKVNGAMKTSSVGSNSRSPTPSPMEGKHSRFAMLGRLFKPWKWKRKKKSDRFEQTSRTLERKISMRSTKEELIKKGVLMPDGTDKDQDSKINDSVHQNHIPQINGFGPESGMSETEKQHNSPSVTYTSSSVLETYNTVVVTNSGISTLLSSSQNHAMPVIHNVSLLNLPDVEEVPSHDGEIVLSVLPEPPISLNDIGPIPPPPMFSNPSPLLIPKFHSQTDPSDDQSDSEEDNSAETDMASPCVVYVTQQDSIINTSTVEEIPAKEPHPMSAMPKKSALKKKGAFTCADFQRLSIVRDRSKVDSSGDHEDRPVPTISVSATDNSDSDSDSDSPILWKDYCGDDEECKRIAKVARKDSLALKLAQRPDIQELIDKNIYIAHSEQESHENKEDVKKKLTRRLSLRPTPEELEQRNILKYQSAEELRKEKEQKKKTLIRKLSFRPTIEELKERKIIRFNDYVEVTQAQDYDRRADKPWTRLTPRDKAAIRKELNEFKSMEMEVHEESRQFTRYYKLPD
ncbi:phosphatase and actin regulator 2 [Trichonephila inaurata madagascariensis]|uniref:Phosphatase and actin regulator 2 n=1 Tax=Trichonephila inaurata madagascariensis TaxID=2747483 RepID=A0A8X6Y518_9ARAC|nr:phosphatase and actin regulator 2 [Trichonephila inaurata madagascariensis]